jgi:hypothetical protein
MRARCVITEHLADRRKCPVWSTEVTYLPGSTAGVPEERSAALIYAGWSASLNRHKIWPDCENGYVKEAFCRSEGALPKDGLLQPVPGHVLRAAATAYEPRTHAASAPAARRRYGGGADEAAPVPVGVTGHRTQRPRGQVRPRSRSYQRNA